MGLMQDNAFSFSTKNGLDSLLQTGTIGGAFGLFGGGEEPLTPWEIYTKSMKKAYPFIARDADRQAANIAREGEKSMRAAGLANTSVLNSVRTGAMREAGKQKQQARDQLYKQSFGMAAAQPQDDGSSELLGLLGQAAGMGLGGMFGGPVGAAAGGALGGGLGAASKPNAPQFPKPNVNPFGFGYRSAFGA